MSHWLAGLSRPEPTVLHGKHGEALYRGCVAPGTVAIPGMVMGIAAVQEYRAGAILRTATRHDLARLHQGRPNSLQSRESIVTQ